MRHSEVNAANNEQWMNQLMDSFERNATISGNRRMPTNFANPNSNLRITEEMNNFASVNNNNNPKDYRIQDVWAHNLWVEMKNIRGLFRQYNYIAVDTEFPGVVAKPIGVFENQADYLYNVLKCNVDLLRIIQLGITLFDEHGNLPEGPYTTWQFNFKFSLTEDMYAQDSIDLLTNSKIQFKLHEEEGVDPFEFAILFISSGLVLTDHTKWLAFHSNFDFGYLMKLVMNMPLPTEECEFFEILRLYFPKVYDIKYLMKSCKNLKGGLQEIADQLDLTRIGPQHQAGSDSLLTGMAFFKIRDLYFEGIIDDSKYCGQLFGLGLTTNGGNSRFSETPENHTL